MLLEIKFKGRHALADQDMIRQEGFFKSASPGPSLMLDVRFCSAQQRSSSLKTMSTMIQPGHLGPRG